MYLKRYSKNFYGGVKDSKTLEILQEVEVKSFSLEY